MAGKHERDDLELPPSKRVAGELSVREKLKKAAPFYFFLNRIEDEPDTHEDLSITFRDLLDNSLGELEYVVHFTHNLEELWLLNQFSEAKRNIKKNMSVLVYYHWDDPKTEKKTPAEWMKLIPVYPNPNKKGHQEKNDEDKYYHHHTKMSLMFYRDGSARVVICTANLMEDEWKNATQGVWVSPELPKIKNANDEPEKSKTNFKTDLLKYLNCYPKENLDPWIERLQQVDMSSVNVCFIASVPGKHSGDEYGHRKMRRLLKKTVINPKPDWNLIAQCSSIGKLGKDLESWLGGSSGKLFSDSWKTLSVIYPSKSQVKSGEKSSEMFFYDKKNQKNQKWLKEQHLCQWKSEKRHRTSIMPHIKTYAQVSSNEKKAAWFLLTSANLSKAAWGSDFGNQSPLKINNYEVGVLFLPEFFKTGQREFSVRLDGKFSNSENEFHFPYDTPPKKYLKREEPYTTGKKK